MDSAIYHCCTNVLYQFFLKFCSCSSDKTVKVWNLDEMMYVETLFGHGSGITSIDALARDRAITAGGRDNTVRIWKIPEESHLILNGKFEEILFLFHHVINILKICRSQGIN